MLKNIMNSKGVTVLSKEQQKSVNGGGGYCRLLITYPNGSKESGGGYFSGSNGSEISAAANNFCVGEIANNPGIRCGYDCAHDEYQNTSLQQNNSLVKSA